MTDSDRIEAFEQVVNDVGAEFSLVRVYPGSEDFVVNLRQPKIIPRTYTEKLAERGYRLVGVTSTEGGCSTTPATSKHR